MKDWRIPYKKTFLETLINEKRVGRTSLDTVKLDKLNKLITHKMRKDKLSELEAINALINEIRQGTLDIKNI